jgi:2-keto-4-pentenoate hydratase/2-oxohepta-3-ene-1,7-dioic acid hydratase in catechol pathway
MRWASFRHEGGDSYGVVLDDGIVDVAAIAGNTARTLRAAIAGGQLADLADRARDGRRLATDAVTLLPTIPDADKILGIGRNYKAHVEELAADAPENPRTFFKHLSSLVGHDQPIEQPKVSTRFDYEGELAVIIGSRGRHIRREDALSHIAGYGILMDGSVRDFQKHSVDAGKNFHKSSSFGPWMVTADEIPDPAALTLKTRLNGEEVQNSSTGLLIYDIPFLIEYLSKWLELLPGDVIATGTPGGVGQSRTPPLWMKAGDLLEVEISGIGILRNPVEAAQ